MERLVSSAWRKGTVKLYANYLRKWGLFCLIKSVKPMNPDMAQVLKFLRTLEDEGLGYGAINTARCALSIILPRINGETVGKHQIIHWFMKSVYERNPPKPRYNRFWDVSLVFNLLKSWPDNKYLSQRDLGFKVAILLLLVTGHRGQTIVALSLEKAEIDKKEIRFELTTLLKSNRTGDPLSTVTVACFREVKKLCVVSAIRAYLAKTEKCRWTNQLLISFVKPFGPISRDTLARWTLRMLTSAGVDTDRYSAHSTRGAVASGARQLGISVKSILAHAGWKTARSFATHYHKKVEKPTKVAKRLLQKK